MSLCLYPAQSQVSCSSPTQTSNVIRNEGTTEQIADYSFSCSNDGSIATVTVTATISPAVTITSQSLTGGFTEAALAGQDSPTLGTVSGNVVTFSNVVIPSSSSVNLTVTNIRVDATSLAAGRRSAKRYR